MVRGRVGQQGQVSKIEMRKVSCRHSEWYSCTSASVSTSRRSAWELRHISPRASVPGTGYTPGHRTGWLHSPAIYRKILRTIRQRKAPEGQMYMTWQFLIYKVAPSRTELRWWPGQKYQLMQDRTRTRTDQAGIYKWSAEIIWVFQDRTRLP